MTAEPAVSLRQHQTGQYESPEPVDPHDRWNHAARGETRHERLDRNYAEILQEVRVAQTGVQLLLAFQLTLVFTPRFALLDGFQLVLYVTSLVLGAASAALLIAPAAFHRIVFQRHLKGELVKAANRYAMSGLMLLMLSLSTSVLLILDLVLGLRLAVCLTSGVMAWFVMWWLAVPLWIRRHRVERSAASAVILLPRDPCEARSLGDAS